MRNWSHIATHLVLLLLVVGGATSSKKHKAPLFTSDQDEIWRDCSSVIFIPLIDFTTAIVFKPVVNT